MDAVILDNIDPNKSTKSILMEPGRIIKSIFKMLFILFLICGSIAVTLVYWQVSQQPGGQHLFNVADFDVTTTPTPFQPIDPTPTYLPTLSSAQEPQEEPQKEKQKDKDKEKEKENEEDKKPSAEDNKPAATIEAHDDRINILVLGSDQRPYDSGFRTDTIILVSINTSDKTISLVSFPRDLYVLLPGWSYERINTAMLYGGFDLLQRTLEYNFGVKASSYVMVNFDIFQTLIDKLGGIDIEAASNFRDIYLDGNYKRITAGVNHMNGATALWYARSRQTSNDLDRARRQQEVLQGVINRIVRTDVIDNARTAYDLYIDNVNTNLKWKDIASLLPLAVHLKGSSQIQKYVIGQGEVYDWITPGGAMVLVPIQENVNRLLSDALGGY